MLLLPGEPSLQRWAATAGGRSGAQGRSSRVSPPEAWGECPHGTFHLCILQGHISGTPWRERDMESLPCFLVRDSSNFDRAISWSHPLQALKTCSPSARLQLGLLFQKKKISSGL